MRTEPDGRMIALLVIGLGSLVCAVVLAVMGVGALRRPPAKEDGPPGD
jgi:hypothetical protein